MVLYKHYIMTHFSPHVRCTKGRLWSSVKQVMWRLADWTPMAQPNIEIMAEVIGRVILDPQIAKMVPLRADDGEKVLVISQLLVEVEEQLKPYTDWMKGIQERMNHGLFSKRVMRENLRETRKMRIERPPQIPKATRKLGNRPPISLRKRKEPITEVVPLEAVVGVVRNNHWIDEEFKPKSSILNKRFRKVWRWIHTQAAIRENYHGETIVLARVEENGYYVVEGLRRIIALKHASPTVEIRAKVVDYQQEYRWSEELRRRREEDRKGRENRQSIYRPSSIKRMNRRE